MSFDKISAVGLKSSNELVRTEDPEYLGDFSQIENRVNTFGNIIPKFGEDDAQRQVKFRVTIIDGLISDVKAEDVGELQISGGRTRNNLTLSKGASQGNLKISVEAVEYADSLFKDVLEPFNALFADIDATRDQILNHLEEIREKDVEIEQIQDAIRSKDSVKRELEQKVYRSVVDFKAGYVRLQTIGHEVTSFVSWINEKLSKPLLDGEITFLNLLKLHCENFISAIQINRILVLNEEFTEESDDHRMKSIIDDIQRNYQYDPAGVQQYSAHEVLEISTIFDKYKQKYLDNKTADEVSKFLEFRDKLIVVNKEVDQSIVQELADINSEMQLQQEAFSSLASVQDAIRTELDMLMTRLGNYLVSAGNNRRHVDRCLEDAKAQLICIKCVVKTYDTDGKAHILNDILKLDHAAKRFADCILRLERMKSVFDSNDAKVVLESSAFAIEAQQEFIHAGQVREIQPEHVVDLKNLIERFTKFLPGAAKGDENYTFNWRIYKTGNAITAVTKEYPKVGLFGAMKSVVGMGEVSQDANNLAVQTAIGMLNDIVNIAKGLLVIKALAPAAAQMQECQESAHSQLLSIDHLKASKLKTKDMPLPFKEFLGLRDRFVASIVELERVNAACSDALILI